MLKTTIESELVKKYKTGERNFQQLKLRRADLRGIKLKGADLRGSDLSYANLKGADLSGCDLRGVYLNDANLVEINLEGAKLEGANLTKAYLTGANIQKANLEQAYLTGAFLTAADLTGANLQGIYANNVDWSGATLKGAIYNDESCFDGEFDPAVNGMEKYSPVKIDTHKDKSIEDLLSSINIASECSTRYLGPILTAKYLKGARSEEPWLQNFDISSSGKITYRGAKNETVTTLQIEFFEQWLNKFIKNCSMIIQDFTKVIEEQQVKK